MTCTHCYNIDCVSHQWHVHTDHLHPAPMSTTSVSKELWLTVVDTQLHGWRIKPGWIPGQ